MPFIHPAIFWTGLAAVSVPILIHLLNRRRFRIKDWAAMQFLLESIRRNRRRLRIEELILLAVRCCILLLAAMAIGRFTGCGNVDLLPTEGASTTIVYVLDDSFSMGQKLAGSTLLSAATTDLSEQLQQIPTTDQVAILLTSSPDPAKALLPRGFIEDLPALTDRLSAVEPSDKRARLPDALAAANALFKDVQGPKRLVLLSDFRRADLTDSEDVRAIEEQFRRLHDAAVDVVTRDYGRAAAGHLTIESLELLDRSVVAGAPARLRVTVRNNGPVPAEGAEIELRSRGQVNGEFVESKLPVRRLGTIDPGAPRSIEVPFTPGTTGPLLLSASLKPDELPGDDHAHLALDVREARRVLVVDGDPDLSDPRRSESFFLAQCLDPGGKGRYGMAAEVVSYDGLSGVDFRDYDLVALLNVPAFPSGADPERPYPQLTALESYVRDGGAVAVFTGDRVDVRFYNEHLWRKGEGLCPYRIRVQVGPPSAGRQMAFARLDPKSLQTDGILSVFDGDARAGAQILRFYAYHQADLIAPTSGGEHARPPRVLARFADSDQSPAMAVRAYGQGAVFTCFSSADKAWNDWCIDPFGTYLVAMNDLVSAIARSQRPRSGPVGVPIVHELSAAMKDAAALLRTPRYPKEAEVSLIPAVEGTKRTLRFDPTDAAGAYALSVRAPAGDREEVLFARNVEPVEGDLAPGGEAAIAAAFGSEDFRYRRMLAAQASGPIGERSDREYWPWIMGALAALLGVELLLGQRFGHYADVKGTRHQGSGTRPQTSEP